MTLSIKSIITFIALATLFAPCQLKAQDAPDIQASAGPSRMTVTNKVLSFDAAESQIPEDVTIDKYLWDFGDGSQSIGEKVTHAYSKPGSYLVRLTLEAGGNTSEDTTETKIFAHSLILLADDSVSNEQLDLSKQQAAEEGLLLVVLKAKSGGPEALIEEELTQQLINARDEIENSKIIAAWTSGSVGANALSKFTQYIKQASELSFSDLDIDAKGLIILSETPFAVLSPTAQSTFDQLSPSYVILTKPDTLSLLLTVKTSDEIYNDIINSPISYRLFGKFSERAISDIGPTNFMSIGINYLINQGVPVNNILLILSIPVIATLLSFARQVIGIKAFGLITPAMTTLVFLAIGLQAGLIVFLFVLLSGTITRILLRRLHMLYLPRMALVLTSASLAILFMFGLGVTAERTATLSFSIFPILIITILAEEFIAAQFSRGAKIAFSITAWTLILAIACYYIVSWQLLRTILLSYPETILLAIPANIILGRFTGLRIVEYFRFRELLRYPTNEN